MTILEARNLSKSFEMNGRSLKAVREVDIAIAEGETFGLVGESGCGKSTLGRTLKGIYQPTSGEVLFDGAKVPARGKSRKDFQRQMQMIFQDPYSSLNPRMTVGEIIGEGLEIHRIGNKAERRDRMRGIMAAVGLNSAYADRYPHEFSGGQRQRIAIARGLVLEPRMVICDEPISALDVSIQGQIINLLRRLQDERGLTYLFVAHDLLMVKYISDRIGVMYLGRLVEVATAEELFAAPLHPYTQALLSSVPIPDPVEERKRIELTPEGELPSPFVDFPGCAFRERCRFATEACRSMRPELTEVRPGHRVMCTLHGTPSA